MAQAGRLSPILFWIEKKILLTNANDQNSTCDNSPQKAWFSSKKLGSPKASCSCPKIIIPFLNTGKNSVTLCLAANKIDFGFRCSSRGTSTYNLIFGYPESAKKLVCRKIEQDFSSFFKQIFAIFDHFMKVLWNFEKSSNMSKNLVKGEENPCFNLWFHVPENHISCTHMHILHYFKASKKSFEAKLLIPSPNHFIKRLKKKLNSGKKLLLMNLQFSIPKFWQKK